VGDMHHIDRLMTRPVRDEMEDANHWPRGTMLRILTVHVLWALHTWHQRSDTFGLVQADLKPDNVFLRAVDPSVRHVRLPMQWQTKRKSKFQDGLCRQGEDGVVDELFLPNIGLFAIVGDYGCSTLYERTHKDEPWTCHSEEQENTYGVIRLPDDEEKEDKGKQGNDASVQKHTYDRNMWEDWGVHPEKICPGEPHRNSYDLDFFLNLVTRMMLAAEEKEDDNLKALAQQLRACIEPPATFSNEGGYYEMGNGSIDFAAHPHLGETLEDRVGGLYPLRPCSIQQPASSASASATATNHLPLFRADVERPTSLSYTTPERVLRSVFFEHIRARATKALPRLPALRMHPSLAAMIASINKTKKRLPIQSMWEPEEEEEEEEE
jgi:hypothetical protein